METRKRFHRLGAVLGASLISLALGACGAAGTAVDLLLPGALPSLPLDVPGHLIAATHSATLNGADTQSRSAGAVVQGTTLNLPSAAGGMEWGLWRYVPDTAQSEAVSAVHIGLNVGAGTSGWIGIANYALGTWEFRGPFNASGGGGSKDFTGLDTGGYLSPAGNLYFIAIAADGTSASVPTLGITSDVTPPPTFTVSGTAVDSSNSNGLPGVTVHLNPGNLSMTTGATGAFSFSNLNAGSYTLTADTLTGYDPFTPASIPVTVGPDSPGHTFSAAPTGPQPVTYETGAGVIKALMNANCLSCHGPGGPETPLTNWTQVNNKRLTIAAFVVDVKNMPPSGMAQADRDKFAQWRADGYQQ